MVFKALVIGFTQLESDKINLNLSSVKLTYLFSIVYPHSEHFHFSKTSSALENGNKKPSSHFGHGGNMHLFLFVVSSILKIPRAGVEPASSGLQPPVITVILQRVMYLSKRERI